MTLRYFLTDYTEESYPAELPTLAAWAAWLSVPDISGWEHEPAVGGEVFAGTVEAEVYRVDHTVGDEAPVCPVTFDWVAVEGEWECSGGVVTEALDGLDDGDEVTLIFYRSIARTYRFEVIGGVPALVDTDPATAPTPADFGTDPEQPSLFGGAAA